MTGKKIVILGGGVAGLTAAHELCERGFLVEVYEKADALGGKARSDAKPNSGVGGKLDLPGEHGFRFFPGFYQHVTDTMSRIPLQGTAQHVLDNLVVARQSAIAQEMKPLYVFLTHLPQSIADWILVLQDWFMRAELGLQPSEAQFFISRLLDFMTMCTKRRFAELENEGWWQYIDAQNRSLQYQRLLARGLTRSLVAMRAEVANTRTVGSILVQMMMSLTTRSATMDRVLNAPTSDAWIKPWTDFLSGEGVTFFTDHAVSSFNSNGSRITGVQIQSPSGLTTVNGDYYIAAFPVEVAQTLLTSTFSAVVSPSLDRIRHLQVEWMNGLQFYLARDVSICRGHVICADSPWAVTCIAQPQFWLGTNMANHGDGTTPGLISIDISDWDTPGNKTTTKSAKQCTEVEIVAEVWAQLLDHLQSTHDPLLNSDKKSHFLDPSIVFGQTTTNTQPLLVNTVGSWNNRPEAATEIPNLFLASDYVRTNTDLATMEGANEAARRAVNAILDVENSSESRCEVWEFGEPQEFEPLKQVDEVLFNWGLPHPGFRTLRLLTK